MNAETSDEAEEQKVTIFDQREGVDWCLAYFVGMAERGFELGVTLSVGGQLVSGTLISGRKYFEALSATIKSGSATGSPDARAIVQAIGDGIAHFKDLYPPADEIADDYVAQPTYVHLRNAKVFLSDRPMKHAQLLWRLQLSRIDGFTPGVLTFT